MPKVSTNGVEIEYDTFGIPSNPALLLIMGLNTQMIAWDENLCRQLTDKGLFVIRLDNRDIGLSTKKEEWGVPDLEQAISLLEKGQPVTPPYTIDNMAADAFGVLDALAIKKAHVCGGSMGGFIAQTMALAKPERLLTLTSIYSHPGVPPVLKPEISEMLLAPVQDNVDDFIRHTLKTYRIISGKGFEFDEEWHLNYLKQACARSFSPVSRTRQLMAVLTQKNRKPGLASLNIPTLVIHGDQDPLVPLSGGRDTAATIPGAELLIIEGMGHDLPHGKGPWPRAIEALLKQVQKSG